MKNSFKIMTKATDDNGQYWYVGPYRIHKPVSVVNESYVVTYNNRSIGVFPNLKTAVAEILIEQGWTCRHVNAWAEEISKTIA